MFSDSILIKTLKNSCLVSRLAYDDDNDVVALMKLTQGDRISLSQQVINFERTLDGLKSMIGASNISRYLARSVVIMSFGSNDYINNYLMPSVYDSSYKYRPPEFANLLLNRYTLQLLVCILTVQ